MSKKLAFTIAPRTAVNDNADAWVGQGIEQHLQTTRAEVAPAERMKRLTIDVSESLHARIKVDCARRGVKIADEVRELLEKHFPALS
jgi:predicted DNA binding CopG/RHH family protein